MDALFITVAIRRSWRRAMSSHTAYSFTRGESRHAKVSKRRTVLGQVAAAEVVALLLQHQRQRVPAEDEAACATHDLMCEALEQSHQLRDCWVLVEHPPHVLTSSPSAGGRRALVDTEQGSAATWDQSLASNAAVKNAQMRRTKGEVTQDGHREQDEAGVAVLEVLLAHAGHQPLSAGPAASAAQLALGVTT